MKVRIQPTVVILSTRVDEAVEMYFDPDVEIRGSVHGDGELSIEGLVSSLINVQKTNSSCLTSWNPALPQNSYTVLQLKSLSA